MKCFAQGLAFHRSGESLPGCQGASDTAYLVGFCVTKRAGNTSQLELNNILFWLYS